jgi:hypothetical protein
MMYMVNLILGRVDRLGDVIRGRGGIKIVPVEISITIFSHKNKKSTKIEPDVRVNISLSSLPSPRSIVKNDEVAPGNADNGQTVKHHFAVALHVPYRYWSKFAR